MSKLHFASLLEALAVLLSKPLSLGKDQGLPYLSKTTVHRNVQGVGQKVRRLRQAWLSKRQWVKVIGADTTKVKCKGESIPVGAVVDDLTGIELTIDILEHETAETQLAWIREIAELVGATVQWLVETHPHDGKVQFGALHLAYCQAPAPREGERATISYRMGLLTLDLWEDRSLLTLYQRWRGPQGEHLDSTNNASERAIGRWTKERYRSMRGYKRPQSVLIVSSLLGWLGGQPTNYDFAELVGA